MLTRHQDKLQWLTVQARELVYRLQVPYVGMPVTGARSGDAMLCFEACNTLQAAQQRSNLSRA